MKGFSIIFACCLGLLTCSSVVCEAGPSKYCGVVIFDRWDGCILYSGVYVMYVTEKVKEGLRKYAGQAIQIDAKEVDQPDGNPGDSIIRKFEYIGVAPETRNWVPLEGICLTSSAKVSTNGNAIATITIENKGNSPVTLFSSELGLTLLVHDRSWSVGDGPSAALITRQSFFMGSEPRWQCSEFAPGGKYFGLSGNRTLFPRPSPLRQKGRSRLTCDLIYPMGSMISFVGMAEEAIV